MLSDNLALLLDLISKDKELGRFLFGSEPITFGRKKVDDSLITNFVLVHDPSLPEDVKANVKSVIKNQNTLIRIAIRDVSEIEKLGSYLMEYCEKVREKQINGGTE